MTRQPFQLATVDGPGTTGRTVEYVDLARLVDYLTRMVETLAESEEVAQRGSFLGDTQNPTHYTPKSHKASLCLCFQAVWS